MEIGKGLLGLDSLKGLRPAQSCLEKDKSLFPELLSLRKYCPKEVKRLVYAKSYNLKREI